MSFQPPDKTSFAQKYADAVWLARFPALTILTLLRKDLGYRILSPLALFAVNGILALVAILAMPGSHDGGPLALLLFAILSFLSGMSQRFKKWREWNRNVRSHSYYLGSSPFNFKWLPEFCRQNGRVERFFDPIVCALVGLVLLPSLPALALWIGFSSACLRVFEHAVFMRERNRDMDIFDSIAISQHVALVIEPTEHTTAKGQPPQQGIQVGLGPDIAEKIKLRKMKNNSMKCQLQTTTTCTGTAADFPSNTANKQQKQNNSNNMSTSNIPSNVWKKAFDIADAMPPLKTRKSPAAAAVIGFAFGGLGLGIYFGTILDFVVPFTILVILFFFAFPTAGLALLFLPFVCALWGYKRAAGSNARLDAKTGTSVAVVAKATPALSEAQRN
jgi:hypothetical protein